MTALTKTTHRVNAREASEEQLPGWAIPAAIIALAWAIVALLVDMNADAWLGR